MGSRVAHVRELKTELEKLKAENAALRKEKEELAAHLDLAILAAEDLRLFVDLTTLPANRKTGTLPVRAVLPSGVSLVSTDPDTVKVSLKE